MRVALLQSKLDPKSPSANTQGLIALIRRAASTRPAPDLLILPGACDTGGASVKDSLSEASMQCVRGSLAFEARDWGVYIAAGLHDRVDGGWVPASVLFDPDGDVVASAPWRSGPDQEMTPSAIAFWSCATGRMGVCAPSVSVASGEIAAGLQRGGVVAAPTTPTSAGKRRQIDRANLQRLRNDPALLGRGYWAVVTPARTKEEPADRASESTFLMGAAGRVLGAADTAFETIVYTDLPLETACVTPDEVTPNGHAD